MFSLEAILPYYMATLIVFIFSYLLIKYIYNVKKQNKYFRYILISLRFSTILLLLLILFNPNITINDKIIKNKKIAFFIDNSQSISSSINSFDLINELERINDYLIQHKIEPEYYAFGDTLKKIKYISELTFDDTSTDFNQITKTINKIDANQYILISDGMQNEGMIKKSNTLSNPIHSFGIGKHEITSEDLKLDSLIVFYDDEDSIDIKCQISSNTINDYDNIKINLSNQKYNNINISTLNIKSGQDRLFHNIKINKDILTKNNIISIENIKSEINSYNNSLNLEIDETILKTYKTLLISGRLSNNTKFIKKILHNNKNIDFEHIFKQEEILALKEQNYDIIIFDSFPINNEQVKIINNKILNSSKFIYFQGPIVLTDSFIPSKFLLNRGYAIDIIEPNQKEIKDVYLEATGNNDIIKDFIAGVIPFNSNFSVSNNNPSTTIESIVNKQNKESIFLDYMNDSLFVFISDLKSLSSETKRFNSRDNLTHLIDYYINRISSNDDILNVYMNKINFYKGENLKIYLNINNKYFKDYTVDLFIYNKNNEIVSKVNNSNLISNNLYEYNIKINDSEKYYIEAVMKHPHDILIKSNKLEFNIFDIDKELNSIGLNEEILRKISFDTKGEYHTIDELFDYIMKINQSQLTTFKLNKFNIFNFQPFWFIILLLMILEWAIRKNKGLL